MRKTLPCIFAACLAAGTAQADTAFSHGDISLGGLIFPDDPLIRSYQAEARGDYKLGSLGLQLDGQYNSTEILGFESFTSSAIGAHVYKPTASGHKLGVFASLRANTGLISSTTTSAGVEGMLDFGALDLELSAAARFSSLDPGAPLASLTAFAYYDLSGAFELSAGVRWLGELGGSGTTLGIVSASYDFPNSNFALVGEAYLAPAADPHFGLRMVYRFGNDSDERLFSTR